MSYDRQANLVGYKLAFEELPGLTVRMRQPGLRGLIDIAESMAVLRRSIRESWPDLDVRNLRAWRRLSRAFAASLVSWTLVADGEPVAPTLASVLDQDLDFLITLVRGWQQAISDGNRPQVAPDAEPDGTDPEPDDDGSDDGPGEWDPDNPELDEEWVAQLPTVPNQPAPPDLVAVSGE